MTKPLTHVVTLPKAKSRGPFAPTEFIPVCNICGPLDHAMDLDAAKSKRAGHARFVASVDAGDGGAL